jgi:hypothetical protein
MLEKMVNHFHDVLLSVYIYNEYRGYSKLAELLETIKARYPLETEFHEGVSKHIGDERKHYLFFKNYFNKKNSLPFRVGPAFGYVDSFIRLIFKRSIEDLDREGILADEQKFFKLCRLIMMTEERGLKQVRALLKNRWVKKNPWIVKVFEIVEQDEPSHFEPYRKWLRKNKRADEPGFREKLADLWIHWSLMLVKLPFLYLNIFKKRLTAFPAD